MLMRDKYEFLSNFYSDPKYPIIVEIEGKKLTFRNSEAAFQAHKNPELADKFCLLTAYEAKKYGRQIPLAMSLDEWNNKKRYYAMATVLHNKFLYSDLMEKLLAVTEPIGEDNYWNDTFWGVCTNKKYNHEGKNVLGQMLTCIKETNNNFDELITLCDKLIQEYTV